MEQNGHSPAHDFTARNNTSALYRRQRSKESTQYGQQLPTPTAIQNSFKLTYVHNDLNQWITFMTRPSEMTLN